MQKEPHSARWPEEKKGQQAMREELMLLLGEVRQREKEIKSTSWFFIMKLRL